MTFVKGKGKVIIISGSSLNNPNALEVILRDAGRFVVKYSEEFIALSDKKSRTFNVSGSIGTSEPAQYVYEYEENPVALEFQTAEVFPQDLMNEYKVDEVDIYGVMTLVDISLSTEPSDAIARLLGTNIQQWISRQPLTSWNNEDSVVISAIAYNHLPKVDIEEGILKTTAKKRLVPIFTPIKTHLKVLRMRDIVYLYGNITAWGYCAASTAGGSFAGSVVVDQRLVIGQGFLPEEVEELLSPSQ